MSGVQIDSSDVRKLAAELTKAPLAVATGSRAVVEKGAHNIKQAWQRRWSGLSHAPSLASAVTYDLEQGLTSFGAEIGPDKGRPQGALGNLLEYGSVNGGARPAGSPSLDEERPKFEAALTLLAVKALPQ